jgi:hypothetical protein
MTNQLSSTTALQNAVASSSRSPGNLTRSIDSSKRLDHFAAKLLVRDPGIYFARQTRSVPARKHSGENLPKAVEVRN